jgi:hypothetical protein
MSSRFNSGAIEFPERSLPGIGTDKVLSVSSREQRVDSHIAELHPADESYDSALSAQHSTTSGGITGYKGDTVDLTIKPKFQNFAVLAPERQTAVYVNRVDIQWNTSLVESSAKTLHAKASVGKSRTLSNSRADEDKSSLDWVEENCSYLEGFAGEWILVVGRELIAHSVRHKEILRIVKERRPVGALIHYVPRVDETAFVL